MDRARYFDKKEGYRMRLLSDFPRVSLGCFPTPLVALPNLSRMFGKRLYLKRDDMTGVGFGGNKVRKLEFLLADAQNKGASIVMTTGGAQSNHAMLTAACCGRLGMQAVLLLKDRGVSQEVGNVYLDHLLGAEVVFVDTDDYRVIYEEMARRKTAYAAEGKVAYEIPLGGSNALGALGYVECFRETMAQCKALGIHPDRMVSAVGSGGTYAGLCAGADLYAPDVKVTGVAVDSEPFAQICTQLKAEISGLLELEHPLNGNNVELFDNVGAGYGIPGQEEKEAVELMAREEGIFLDPVYTGKAFSLLLRKLGAGEFQEDETIVFLHSGGAGGLFAIPFPGK